MVKLSIMFWNLNRRDRAQLLIEAAQSLDIDVLILAESPVDERQLSDHSMTGSRFTKVDTIVKRLQFYIRDPHLPVVEGWADASSRMSVNVMNFAGHEILLAAVHFGSKAFYDERHQETEIQSLVNDLVAFEAKQGHRRTLVIGDFNVNPFESGMVKAAGFHAMTTRRCVERQTRTVQGREYPLFYNPMWQFFGDQTVGPPGTYFNIRSGEHLSYNWNMFDQVLLRPELLPWFQNEVEIITSIGKLSLADEQGFPDAEVGSDHFPILATLRAA